MTNLSTRKILVGTAGAGSWLASVALTRLAHAGGAGAATEIGSRETDGAATKATSSWFW